MTSGNKLKPIASRLILIIGALLPIDCNEKYTTNPACIAEGFDFAVNKPNA